MVTVGLVGLIPAAPGTCGALVAIPLAWALAGSPWFVWALVLALSTVLSIILIDRYLVGRPDDDPSEVVIDELVGCLLALWMVPWQIAWVVAAFVLFRLFDIFKPWPIGPVDRKVKGGLGVMGDDVLAGLFAGLILLGVRHLGLWQGWWA